MHIKFDTVLNDTCKPVALALRGWGHDNDLFYVEQHLRIQTHELYDLINILLLVLYNGLIFMKEFLRFADEGDFFFCLYTLYAYIC